MQQIVQTYMDIHQNSNEFKTINHIEQKILELAVY